MIGPLSTGPAIRGQLSANRQRNKRMMRTSGSGFIGARKWSCRIRRMANEPDAASDVFLEINPETGSRLTVLSSDGRTDQYSVSFHACQSPTCGCFSVELVCTPLGDSRGVDTGTCIIALDIRERGPQQPLRDAEQTDITLTRVVADGLTSENWHQLRAWLVSDKRQAMENMDLDSLEAHFPSGVMTDGMMVAYDEIFPFAEPLTFSADGQSWCADDQYCVQPDCTCTEAVLSFFSLEERKTIENGQEKFPVDHSVSVVAAVRYDIRGRSMKVEDSPSVSSSTARRLMTALEEGCLDFPEVVAERRRQLRHLYRRSIKGNLKPHSRPAVATPKIGRNQPCPCGSGKKFKRCCGR